MERVLKKDKVITMKLDTEELSPIQLRLIKSIHSLMASVISTEEESEYFECGADLLKKAVELIKHSNFAEENKKISYGTQAVEYALDSLNETIENESSKHFDN